MWPEMDENVSISEYLTNKHKCKVWRQLDENFFR